jgi:D-alanyl-D-alanine carboxypeptidase
MQLAPIPVLHGQADTVDIAVDMPQSLLLKKGTERTVEPSAELASDLEAPVHAGQVVGTWRLKSGDQTLCEYAVRATADVLAKTFRYAYSLLVTALLA